MTWKTFWRGVGNFFNDGLANFGSGAGYGAGGFSPQASPTYDPKDPEPLSDFIPDAQGVEIANNNFDTDRAGSMASSYVGSGLSHY